MSRDFIRFVLPGLPGLIPGPSSMHGGGDNFGKLKIPFVQFMLSPRERREILVWGRTCPERAQRTWKFIFDRQ